jgi:hypothetical protein
MISTSSLCNGPVHSQTLTKSLWAVVGALSVWALFNAIGLTRALYQGQAEPRLMPQPLYG